MRHDTVRTKAKPVCPICGDRNVYALWVSAETPDGCPEGPHVRTVTDCRTQMARAEQAALFRKAAPECFDANGNMLPGLLGVVLERAAAIKPNHSLVPAGGVLLRHIRRHAG